MAGGGYDVVTVLASYRVEHPKLTLLVITPSVLLFQKKAFTKQGKFFQRHVPCDCFDDIHCMSMLISHVRDRRAA